MASNQSTFIQLPSNVTNPLELRRFLDKLVQQLDIAFGNRGNNSFASSLSLSEVLGILNNYGLRLDNIEGDLSSVISDVEDIKKGEVILPVSSDTILGSTTETVLCDCSGGDINITLPDPQVAFSSSRSKIVSISKIDTTLNKVRILPFNSETIVGESIIELVLSSEVINLITNGTNWYLGA